MLLLSLITLQLGHGHIPGATVSYTLTVTTAASPRSADDYMYMYPPRGMAVAPLSWRSTHAPLPTCLYF